VPQPSLRRYTDLPPLIHLLKHKRLTLLDPSSWGDKNDSYFLSLYREKCRLKSVPALCFTKSQETNHHRRVFSPDSAGLCVQFDGSALRSALSQVRGVKLEPVEYLTLPRIRAKTINQQRGVDGPGQPGKIDRRSVFDPRVRISSQTAEARPGA
jgi:hypothetical protein